MKDFAYIVLIFSLLALYYLAGCKNTPISQFDEGVAELCTEGEHEYQGKPFTLVFDASYCPPDIKACYDPAHGNIFVADKRTCPKRLAHELRHFRGDTGVDRPRVGAVNDKH